MRKRCELLEPLWLARQRSRTGKLVHRSFALRGRLKITPCDLFEQSVETLGVAGTAGRQFGQRNGTQAHHDDAGTDQRQPHARRETLGFRCERFATSFANIGSRRRSPYDRRHSMFPVRRKHAGLDREAPAGARPPTSRTSTRRDTRPRTSLFRAAAVIVQLTATSPSHIASLATARMRVLRSRTAEIKDNGNNVDLDREMTEITKNGLQYIDAGSVPEPEAQDAAVQHQRRRQMSHESDHRTRYQCQRTDRATASAWRSPPSNLANSQTTRTAEGGAVSPQGRRVSDARRSASAFEAAIGGGSTASKSPTSSTIRGRSTGGTNRDIPMRTPKAMSTIRTSTSMEEMANLVRAVRSYEANIAAINIVKTMINRTLEIGR